MENRILGWHFLPPDGKLAHGDGRVVKVGKTYSVKGPITICEYGLHASRRIIDALEYARGPILCRVKVWGDIQEECDKVCARHRKVLAMADATKVLHEFACRCAEDALSRETNPDPRSVAAIKAKRAWVRGEISDNDFIAAWGAAKAAEGAAESAAWHAANGAGWSAAVAARSAAAAARGGALEAAGNAARDADSDKQNETLTAMAEEIL